MNVLIFDHHFHQDIEALNSASEPDDVIRVVPAEVFASIAHEIFPPDVFGANYSLYHREELAPQRAAYRRRARAVLFELYQTFPFDVFVVPSDIYFYIRDVIAAVRELGIATVAVQKESGVSAQSLVTDAGDTRRWFPFCGDVMSVCSDRSRQFWVAAGARDDQVLILGQPRFDIYRAGLRDVPDPLAALGLQVPDDRPILLFLSYSLDAYAESRVLDGASRPWETLHRETEQTLLDLAREGRYTVLVKPHPQQDASQLEALRVRLANVSNVHMLPGHLDTRHVIVASDVVVGFQTTAIAEAMIARKRVVYTFWTPEADRAKPLLLPFHEMARCIDVATSPHDLGERLRAPMPVISDAIVALREQYCEPYTGLVDGNAARRVWDQALRPWGTKAQHAGREAATLRVKSKEYCYSEARSAQRRAAAWRVLAAASAATPGLDDIAARARARAAAECRRIHECMEGITGRRTKLERLRGPRADSVIGAARRFVRAWFDAPASSSLNAR